MKKRLFVAAAVLNILLLTGCDTVNDIFRFEDVGSNVTVEDSAIEILPYTETLDADTKGKFRYSQLSDDEKIVYEEISKGMEAYAETIHISCEINEASLRRIYEAVIYEENSQMFFAPRAYKYSYDEEEDLVNDIVPCYIFTKDEKKEAEERLKVPLAELKKEIRADMTSKEKIKAIHDFIVRKCTYIDFTGFSDDEINDMIDDRHCGDAYGTLVLGGAICEGYSRAFRYLCTIYGIECELINGTGDNIDHMWNIVRTDGKWYHVDVTWDDPVINGVSNEDTLVHDYFGLSDEEILKDHVIENDVFLYPACEDSTGFDEVK